MNMPPCGDAHSANPKKKKKTKIYHYEEFSARFLIFLDKFYSSVGVLWLSANAKKFFVEEHLRR